MIPVFLDTVGLLALWNKDDQWHAPAQKAFAHLKKSDTEFLTTSCIFLECGNAAARTGFRSEVNTLRQQFEEAELLIHPGEDDWKSAWQAYHRGEADSAGIVDHISFVIMRRLGLRQSFTNDRHFKAAGFQTLF